VSHARDLTGGERRVAIACVWLDAHAGASVSSENDRVDIAMLANAHGEAARAGRCSDRRGAADSPARNDSRHLYR